MKKNLFLVVVAMTFAISLTFGQSHRELPIYRYFNAIAPDSTNTLDSTDITYGGWSIQSVAGTLAWYVGHYSSSGNYYAHCNGYATPQAAQEQWFISPGFSTVTYTNAILKFSSCQKFTGSPIQIMVSTDYDGISLPATGTWSVITSGLTLPPANASGPRVWYSSGNVDLSSYSGANVYVAFKYTCDATNSTDWEVDSIKITSTGVGIRDVSPLRNSIAVYPNPVSSILYLNNLKGIEMIRVYNLIGETIENISISGNIASIDVSTLKKGLYFISFMDQNRIVSTKKFSKE
jgi:hypothetical protein